MSYIQEYKKMFNEPEASTLWKAYYHGLSMEGYMYFVVEVHVLEKMAQAGLFNRRQWHERYLNIHNEAGFIGEVERPDRIWVFNDAVQPRTKEGEWVQ